MKYLILLVAAVLFLTSAKNYAQSRPSLTITSPSEGTVIKPGQSLTVTVEGSNVPAPSQEGLLVSGRIPSPALQSSASSNSFVLSIPSNLGPGTYDITAVETSADGPIDSATVSVVLQPNQFDELQIDTALLLFQNLTEQFPLIVTGFVNGATQQVPSQFLIFKSSDPSIAEVDSNGIVTPISAGTTHVTASYGTLSATTKVTVAGAFLSLPTAFSPAFSPAAGSFTAAQTVTVADATHGATIYYTTDGTTPSTSSAAYSSPLRVLATETVQAIAVASGYAQSPVASATYRINIPIAAIPNFSPAAGTYTSAQTVTISDATSAAAVYYTTDGSTPTTSSTLYSSPITVGSTETIQAIAVGGGYSNSAVASATYSINPATQCNATINYGDGFTGSKLTLNGGATIADNTLQLTDGKSFEARSAFYPIAVPIASFVTDFTFQLLDAEADGIAFVVQTNSPKALGEEGGGLGFAGIPNSLALKFDLHNNSGEGSSSTGIFLNGSFPAVPSVDLLSKGIDLHSGHIFAVHLVYNGSILTGTITDTVTKASFTGTDSLPLGSTKEAAFVGFTGGTGRLSALQNILSWTYNSTIACPAKP